MGETRTYKMSPGDYQGSIGGEERIFTVEGSPSGGKEVEVLVDDPATQEFIESMGKVATHVEYFEDKPAPASADAEGDGFEDMTVSELQDELRNREMGTSGSKAELIDRLRADTGGDS